MLKPAFVNGPLNTVLFFTTVAVWAALEARQALNRRTGAKSEDRGSLSVAHLVGATGPVLAAIALAVPATRYPVTTAVFGAGLALIWLGIGLRAWCFRTLGRYFTYHVMTSPDQPVIASGPYRVLRHPSYAALLLIVVGIGAMFGSWLSFAVLVALPMAGIVFRIRVEEAALSRTIGAAYVDFARGRKRLIPFVW